MKKLSFKEIQEIVAQHILNSQREIITHAVERALNWGDVDDQLKFLIDMGELIDDLKGRIKSGN